MYEKELAGLLMQKVDQDEYVLRRLAEDPQAPNEILGFHAQQSVEKRMKAVLACNGIVYRRTHDILELIDILNDNNLPFPQELETVQKLTRYAVELRYGAPLPSQTPLLMSALLLEYAFHVRLWAENLIATG